MAVTDTKSRGTLGAAVAGACFLIRAENASRLVSHIAFTPIASTVDSNNPYPPLISFSNSEAIVSPSYYLLQMFTHNQGDVVLKTEVNTYSRPQIKPGLPPDSLVVDESLPPLPSIVSNATLDKTTRTLLLKVVNTTLHDEITEIIIHGASANSQASILQLKGMPEWRNTLESPNLVIPIEESISFPLGRNITYKFPPNSVTILKLELNK
jgi:alpha-L-arabinofuranosidase